MPHFPHAQTKARSPRVRVPNQERIRFNIDGKLVPAVLRKISMTGGLVEFQGTLGEVSIAEAMIETASGQVRGLVEFLRAPKKLNSHSYGFRFIALSDADYKRLQATLTLMRKLGLGES
jgi:hypothetical protein